MTSSANIFADVRPSHPSQGTFRVFVYGSLLQGLANHWLIEPGTFLGETRTKAREGGFNMFDLGPFPGVLRGAKGAALKGEIYHVNAATLAKLDALEEHPTVYRRELLETELGLAWTYLYQGEAFSRPLVLDCDWRSHLQQRGDGDLTFYARDEGQGVVNVSSQQQRFNVPAFAEAA